MIDLMKCKDKNFNKKKFYFPVSYQPSNGGRTQLSREICNSACFSGFSAFNDGKVSSSNQMNHNPKQGFRILYQKYQVYRNRTKKSTHKEIIHVAPTDTTSSKCTKNNIVKYSYKEGIRNTSAVNDKKNQRKNGKALPKRSYTNLCIDKNHRCRFQLTVRCKDDNNYQQYYVAGGLECQFHTHHMKMYDNTLITRRKSIIPPKALQHMKDLKDYSIFNSVNQSLHFRRYGFFVSLAQVKNIVQSDNYICGANGNVIVDLPNFLKKSI